MQQHGLGVALEVWCRGDGGGRLHRFNYFLKALPSSIWSRWVSVACEETTFQVLKLFGVGVTLDSVCGSLSPRHGASSGCGWRNGLRYGG